jgi:hypothetical protein
VAEFDKRIKGILLQRLVHIIKSGAPSSIALMMGTRDEMRLFERHSPNGSRRKRFDFDY